MSIDNSRRKMCQWMAAGALLPELTNAAKHSAEIAPWHENVATSARALNTGTALKLMIPNGSGANIKPAVDAFAQLGGVNCQITEVDVDQINIELILRSSGSESAIDVALPATFGIPDLAEAGAIAQLDKWAAIHEPDSLNEGYLYRTGDYYKNHLYGYQTDGDCYLLFYNKRMLLDPAEQKAYLELTGQPLRPARTWEELDQMMTFFHRPDNNQFGGCLFRNPGYLVWEWWARFHAKGYFPFNDNLYPNINNDAGVAALTELIKASAHQTEGSATNGLFDNWADFSKGNIFCDIGWGGTQKYLLKQPGMRNNLVHGALPGPSINNTSSSMGYFNWGWNYTVSSRSSQPELSYLFCLFCASPEISTMAIREQDGYFDPFHARHYADTTIKTAYGESFLQAHQQALSNCMPDLYLSGQSNYLDSLRQQILNAMSGEMTPQQALDACAQQWKHISRRLGMAEQLAQWKILKASYPPEIRNALKSS